MADNNKFDFTDAPAKATTSTFDFSDAPIVLEKIQPEVPAGPYKPIKSIDNSFKVDVFGTKLILPRTPSAKAESEPIVTQDKNKSLFNANLKELGIDESILNDDSNRGIFYQNRITEKFNNDLAILKQSTPDEIADFIQVKKQNLSNAQKREKEIVDSTPPTQDFFGKAPHKIAGDQINQINKEYETIYNGLTELGKEAAFEASPYMYKDIDTWITKSTQEIISNASQVGNDIQNIGDNYQRNLYKVKADANINGAKYDKLYKEQLAYTGLQSEIYAASKDITLIQEQLNNSIQEIDSLQNELIKDPGNKAIIIQMQDILDKEVKPLQADIDKRQLFVKKLSEATFELPEFAERLSYQDKIDEDYEKYVKSPVFSTEFLGGGSIYAIKGLSNRLLNSVVGASLVAEDLQKKLGLQSLSQEEMAIGMANLSSIGDPMKLPTKFKEGTIVKFDKEGNFEGINWDIAFPMTLQTTGETLIMSAIGAPYAATGTTIGEFAGLYLGASAVFGGDILKQELEKGLSINEAMAVTGLRLGAEAGTEMFNLIEFIPFNGITKTGSKLTKSAYRDFIGKNYQKLFPKLKSMGVDILKVLYQGGKNVGYETIEELMSDLANYGIDQAIINNIKSDYKSDNTLSLQNEINTALTTALTMLPMAGYAGIAEVKNDKQAATIRYTASQMPKLFLTNLKDNLDKGLITEDFYNTGKKEVETIDNIYTTNKDRIESVDKNLKSSYLNALYEQRDLTEKASLETDVKKKEALLSQLENKTKEVLRYTLEANKNLNLTPIEKQQKAEKIVKQNLKDFVSEEELKQASISDLQVATTVLEEVINNPISPKIKEEAISYLEVINNEIIKKQELAQKQKEVSQYELEKQEIPTLSKTDLEAKQSSLLSREDLSESEQEELYNLISDQIQAIDEEASNIPFNNTVYKKGQWIKSKDHEGVYQVDSITPEGKLLVKFADGSQEIAISEGTEITPVSDEEARQILQPKDSFIEETPKTTTSSTIDIEAKKADIERRRLIELEGVPFNPENREFQRVNAKYNAELAALETPVTQETLIIPEKPIEEVRQEVTKQAETETKSQEKKAKEVATFQAKRSADGIVGTIGQTSRLVNGVEVRDTDPAVIRWDNTLTNLHNLSIEEAKPLSELGYYVKVVSGEELPESAKRALTIQWEQGQLPEQLSGKQKIPTKQDIKNTRVVIITNSKGEFLHFDQSGNKTTQDKGEIAHGALPLVFEKNGKLELSKDSIKVRENLPQQDIQRALSRLQNIRHNPNRVYEISRISDGWNSDLDKSRELPLSEQSIDSYAINIPQTDVDTIKKGEAYIQLNSTTSKIVPVRSKIGEDLATLIADFVTNNPQDWNAFNESVEVIFYNLREKRDKSPSELYIDYKNKQFLSKGKPISKEEFITRLSSIPINISNKLAYGNVINNNSRILVPFREDNQVKFRLEGYKSFLSNFLSITIPTERVNRYLELGSEVSETPQVDQPEIPKSEPKEEEIKETPVKNIPKKKREVKPLDLEEDSDLNEDFLARAKYGEVIKTTPEQEKEAEEWFNTHPLRKYITFRDFRNIINSDAFATYRNAIVTLWKGGKFTDTYEEMWHVFSQLTLTKRQKLKLYNELLPLPEGQKAISDWAARKKIDVKSLSQLEKYKAIEELIGSDFLKYVNSGQKLILNRRPERNTIFRQLFNYLKELVTGRVSLQTYYERLYTGNINKYLNQLNSDNAFFGNLNRRIEGKDGRILSISETKDMMGALDRSIASLFEANPSININRLFTEKGALNKLYNRVNRELYNQNALGTQMYNDLVDEYTKTGDEETLTRLNELGQTVDNLSFIVDNWEEVKNYHKTNSYYLRLSKEIIDDSDDVEDTPEQIYDREDGISSREDASYRILFTIASLPKYINKEAIPNQFIPIQFTKKGKEVKDWVNPDIVDFDRTWNLLSKELQGIRNYDQIWDKLGTLSERNPEFQQLISKLPNPTKELTSDELALKTRFVQDLSKPLVPQWKVTFSLTEDGKLIANTFKSGATVISRIRSNFYFLFQERPSGEFVTLNPESNQNELNIPKILEEFKKFRLFGKSASKNERLRFLQTIGFEFSPNTIANLDDIIDPKQVSTKDSIQYIYEALEQWNTNIKDIALADPLRQLSTKSITDKDGSILFSGVKSDIDRLLSKEAEFNDDYYSDNIQNANGDNVYQIERWSLQTVMFSLLNDFTSYPTYQDLINSPLGYIFNIVNNPDANNIYMNSMFNLSTGERRLDSKGNPIQIQLINEDGLEVQGTENQGTKTVQLTRSDKFLQDFNSLLTSGIKEHVRYGDKNSAKGTLFTNFINDSGQNTGFLPVPIQHFNNSIVPNSAKTILKNILISELTRSKDRLQGINTNIANLGKNTKELGFFDAITKGELENKLLKELETKTPEQVVIDNNQAINTAIDKYFEAQVKLNTKELNSIPLEDAQKVASNLNISTETALRAYTVNSWILNAEHIRLLFGDVRFYDAKSEKEIITKKEPFKRFSKGTSTGLTFLNDAQTNTALSNLFPRLLAKKFGVSTSETGIIQSVIFNEDERTSNYLKAYHDYWFKVAKKSAKEADSLVKPFKNMKIGDGQGWITLDEYRSLKLREGSDHWTNEHEELYRRAVEGKLGDYESLLRFNTLFSVVKVRYTGWTKDQNNGKAVPVDYKFSLLPLLPEAILGTPFQQIHENLIKQGVGIALFQSGSKHSAVLNPDGKYNPFYADESKTVPYTGQYTTNPIHYEFLFDVLNVEPEFKDEVRFSTQLRKLLFSNQFDNGVPEDYTKKDWEKLSESEKEKASPIYKSFKNVQRIIEAQVDLEKQNLISILGAKFNADTNTYILDEQKFSELLEDELLKRNLPDNVIESIKVVDGKFKYPLDASVVRQTLETVALSIIDNRLRKQKSFGESTVMASSAGMETQTFTKPTTEELEKYGFPTNGQAFYQYLGRTLKNGLKVTSAQKVKLSIGMGDFKKLLNLKSEEGKVFTSYPNPLAELNKHLKNDKWLDSNNHREMISITGVKIPVQGHNSMEFMEIIEFLPEGTTALIVAPELVAKSGGDFDVDKLSTLFPSLFIDANGDPKLYTELSDSQIDAKYQELKNQIDILPGDKASEETQQAVDKLIGNIFGFSVASEIKTLLLESINKDSLPSKNSFRRIFKKAALSNSMNQEIRSVLEQSSNFGNLMQPNDTDMFEPYADVLRKAKLGQTRNYWSDILTTKENLNQLASSWGSRASLGIGAVANTFFAQMQGVGMYLEPTYNKFFGDKVTVKKTIMRLPHNTIHGNISISSKYDWRKNAGKAGYNTISEAISQLMNGWVDAAKKDWVYYINGIKEIAPTQLYMLMVGIDNETMASFTNQPIIDDYITSLKSIKSLSVKLFNPDLYNSSKKQALVDTFRKYLPWKDGKYTINKKEYLLSNIDEEIYFLRKAVSDISGSKEFTHIWNNDYLAPIAKREQKPTGLEQAMILTHFLELQDQGNVMTNLQQALTADRAKPAFIYASNMRKARINDVKQQGLFPNSKIDALSENTTVSAFNSQEHGIDTFINQLFGSSVFKLTNNPNFNKFIESKWKSDPDLPFAEKYEMEEDWFKTIKNDFIQFLYQNYVHKPNSTELVADKVLNLMKKKRGPDSNLASQLKHILATYPEVVKTTTLLQQLVIDSSKTENLTNIKLKKDNVDRDLANLLTSDFQKLLNFSELSSEDNLIIQQFAQNLAHFGFIQSGLNKSPLYFTNIIPQETYAYNIASIIDEWSNLLSNSPEKVLSDLEKFYNLFKQNNAYKFYNVEYDIDEMGAIFPNITAVPEPNRRKLYQTSVLDEVGDKKQLKAASERVIQEKAKQALLNKVSTYDYKSVKANENPKTLYIYETNPSDTGVAGNGIIKGNPSNPYPNTQGIPIKLKASSKEDAYMSDVNLEFNKLIIDGAIDKIKQKSTEYTSVQFPQEGFNTETSKLKEKAPLTFTYLSEKLAQEFNFIDISATFTPDNTIPNQLDDNSDNKISGETSEGKDNFCP